MDLIAQAVNGSSQGKACDPITVTMPVPIPPATQLATRHTTAAPVAAEPNGKTNGKGITAPGRMS